MREHRLRELVRHESQNGTIYLARCTCGWNGSACFHDAANAQNEHRVHAMRFMDGSANVRCAFCGDDLPAGMAQRFFAPQLDELRYVCVNCQDATPAPTAAYEPDLEVRDDLIVLERELRAC